MENFEYYNPVRVVFGEGSLKTIGNHVKAYGKNALLVSYTDVSFFKSTVETIENALQENGVACTEFFAVTANPLLSQARAGVALCKEKNIDVVIGLGGGSVMDCAKIIAAGVLYKRDIKDMLMLSHSNISSVPPTETLPTVMIPTLPATGSEMNSTAVVTEDESGKKSYVWTPALYPKVAVFEPTLTTSLPPYQTACGAFDIIAHVMEAYVNGAPNVDLTLHDKMQEGVIKATFAALEKVWKEPSDLQARGVLMWAASIGLNGWLTSGTFGFTPMHQMGHVLSAKYNATHGATLCCMMPTWMRYFAKKEQNTRYQLFAKNIFGCDSIEEAADKFEEIIRSYSVQTKISQLGAKEEDLETLADTVVSVSFGADGKMNGNPRTTREDILNMYRLSF